MYKVELMPKQSVIDDILPAWIASGRTYDAEKGIVFESASRCEISGGSFMIESNEKRYYYNMADFYRVKVCESPQSDMFSE